MKKLLFLLLFTNIIYAQTSRVQQDLNNFEPGEIIVKLKDNVDAGITYSQNGKAISNFNIGELLGIENKVNSTKVLFHQKSIEASVVNRENMKAVYAAKAAANPNNSYKPKEPLTMKNVFVLKISNVQENILQLIEQIKDNPAVEYAEPNYIFSVDNFEVGNIITAEEASKMESSLIIDVNDPLYSSQSNITSTNIDDVWDQYTTGDGSQIIAILDTGVDYTHPDLEANIWSNTAELNGVEGYDDDGNGYIDDFRGWDFINIDNAPLDDNMHGTHVAGIAGAVGNNGIGIAGAAWNVKLMPIKVFQASGQGNMIDIVDGINYATENGATIINMSFALGTSTPPITMYNALSSAYVNSLLIASAGNDEKGIGPCIGCLTYFPAAFRFVLGVEDSEGLYDNYDQDGPLFSGHAELLNYEIKSPGTNIISTIPNGGYAELTGTSMAAPLLAGSSALYNEIKNLNNKEILFGDFINSSNSNNFDLLQALDTEPTSIIKIYQVVTDDDISTNQYIDGFINAGETINIYSSVRNFWGTSGNIQMSLEFGGNTYQNEYYSTILNITDSESSMPPLSNYAYNINTSDPFTIEINQDIPHNTEVEFSISAWDENYPDQIDVFDYKINIKNIQKIVGPINNDMTIYPGSYVIDEMVIVDDVTLTIKPGVTISFENYGRFKKLNNSAINAIGTKDSIIEFTRGGLGSNGNGTVLQVDNCTWCKISHGYNSSYGNALGFNLTSGESSENNYSYSQISVAVKANSTTYSNIQGTISPTTTYTYLYNNIVQGSETYGAGGIIDYESGTKSNLLWERPGGLGSPVNTSYVIDGWILAGVGGNMVDIVDDVFVSLLGNTELLKDWVIWDLNDVSGNSFPNSSTNILNIENMRTEPYAETPPFLWKLELNDKLAYYSPDPYYRVTTSSFKVPDYDGNIFQTDPIGVGSVNFKLYFNHAMDTSVSPEISYGVVDPYNQKIITETGTWSTDGTIYTVTHDINVGAADGINRIKITGAKDLIYEWEIPENRNHHFTLQSAGSASTGFFAAGGLGKIDLEWTAPSADAIDDALGYNMYRYIANADGTFTDPVKLNESLIVEDTDESTTGVYYSDFDVEQEQTYFYKYKILRTNFEETDYSSTISSVPLTSELGDSNGDFDVDVMDLVQNVDYILGNNPSPFIFVAADVNNDAAINVLDIVGTVDIILNPTAGRTVTNTQNSINYFSNTPVGDAIFNWEGNDLFVSSNYDVGGIQLAFNQEFEYTLSDNLPGVERLDYTQDDAAILMLYSFNNTVIANTKTKILTRADASQEFDIDLAVVGTTNGEKLNAVLNNSTLGTIDAPFQSNKLELLKLYPNPSDGIVNLQYYLPEIMDGVTVKVYDIQGRLVWAKNLDSQVGKTDKQLNLDALKAGNYIVLMSAHKDGGVKYLSHKMLILQ